MVVTGDITQNETNGTDTGGSGDSSLVETMERITKLLQPFALMISVLVQSVTLWTLTSKL